MAARSNGLRPLLKWPGGKTFWAKKLVGLLPEHRVYVEPFAGGAAVFFRKSPAEVEVLGDTDSFPISFYRKVRKGELKACQEGIRATEQVRQQAFKGKDACSLLAQSLLSFRGNRKTRYRSDYFRDKRIMGAQRLRRLSEYEKRLAKVKLVNQDFEKTMTAFDAPDAVHFLDPPWPNLEDTKMYRGGRAAEDPKRVKRVADRMRGAVVVIYNDAPQVREVMCRRPWTCKSLSGHANAAARKGKSGGMTKRKFLVAIKPAKKAAGRKAA